MTATASIELRRKLELLVSDEVEHVIKFLSELVQIPSDRGNEAQAQKRIIDELTSLGLRVETVPILPEKLRRHTGFCEQKVHSEHSFNVVGILPGQGGGRSLALNFHIDTAPIGPEELWTRSPLSGEVEDGKVFGRGAWDDKAGAALAILVLRVLVKSGISLKGNLIFQSVVEDEHTSNGTLSLVDEGYNADGAIVLDGAYGATAIIGHPGYVNFRITVKGKPAPSCRSELGVNAIEKVFPIMERLRHLETELNSSLPLRWQNVTHPINFNVGTISGGSWTGSVAEKCSFEGQMSFLPPVTNAEFRAQLMSEVESVASEDAWLKDNPPEVQFFDLSTEPLELDPGNNFLVMLSRACERVFGTPLQTKYVTGWCDLRHFQLNGAVPCCLFGPGKGVNAHRPNEYFEVAELVPHAHVILQQLVEWCELSDGSAEFDQACAEKTASHQSN